jgi:hypothetical protein
LYRVCISYNANRGMLAGYRSPVIGQIVEGANVNGAAQRVP